VKLLKWAEERGERFDHCILGEPTNPQNLGDMIKIGRRGSLSGSIAVHGRQGHVAYPHLAENPIRGLVRLLDGVMREPLDEGTGHFDPSNLEFTTVDVGNPASNVIPGEARAVFNIRFNDLWTPETLEAEIRRRLNEAAGNTVRYTAAFEPTNAVSFRTEPDAFVAFIADAIEAETGLRPQLSTTGGTSDARFIKDYCSVVEFGLVGQTMHQVDERVPVADLDALAAIYRGVLERYFAPDSHIRRRPGRAPPKGPSSRSGCGPSPPGHPATRRPSSARPPHGRGSPPSSGPGGAGRSARRPRP
jgi:succinyl-diaminopimelate desuccinylase